jgi:capsular exopolysaccharide synthesis family protein
MIFSQNARGYGWIDFSRLLRSRWPVVPILCSFTFFGGVALETKVGCLYECAVRLELGPGPAAPVSLSSSSDFRASVLTDFTRQLAELRSRSLLSEVVAGQDLATRWGTGDQAGAVRLLSGRSKVEPVPGERAVVLRVRDPSAESSAVIVNAIADRFLSRQESGLRAEARERVLRLAGEVGERHRVMGEIEARLPDAGEGEALDLRRQLVSETYLLRSLEARHLLAAIEAGEVSTRAHLVERAEASDAKKIVPIFLRTPILLLLGLFLAVMMIFLTRRQDFRLDFLARLLRRLELPFAGYTPVCGASLLAGQPLSPRLIEPYRDCRTKLQRLPAGNCLVMTLMSLRDRQGIAEVTTNLACVLADGGSTVLVIDANFRYPQLHEQFDAANHPGLSDFLSGEMRLEETVIKTRRPNLWFMPSGPLHEDPGSLVGGRRMGDLVREMRSRFDYLLIVAPSIHEFAEAGVIAAHADYTAVVTPYRRCSLSLLKKARLAIEVASAQLTAVFLTVDPEGESLRGRMKAVKGEPGPLRVTQGR